MPYRRDPESKAGSSLQGFTLLEVLIAVAVLAIAMVTILHTNIRVQDVLISGQEKTALSLLTHNLLTDIKTEGVENWSQYSGDFPEHPQYTWSLDIQPTRNKALSLLEIAVFGSNQQEPVFLLREYIMSDRS